MQNMLKISKTWQYAKICTIRKTYTKYMPKMQKTRKNKYPVCIICTKNMLRICKNLQKIGMPKICKNYAVFVGSILFICS